MCEEVQNDYIYIYYLSFNISLLRDGKNAKTVLGRVDKKRRIGKNKLNLHLSYHAN